VANNCPNCGAPATAGICGNCRSCLVVVSVAGDGKKLGAEVVEAKVSKDMSFGRVLGETTLVVSGIAGMALGLVRAFEMALEGNVSGAAGYGFAATISAIVALSSIDRVIN